MLREARRVLKKRHGDKSTGRQNDNAHITRPSASVLVQPGDSVLLKDSDSNLHRHNDKGKIDHDRWTGPWTASKILQGVLSVEVVKDGR